MQSAPSRPKAPSVGKLELWSAAERVVAFCAAIGVSGVLAGGETTAGGASPRARVPFRSVPAFSAVGTRAGSGCSAAVRGVCRAVSGFAVVTGASLAIAMGAGGAAAVTADAGGGLSGCGRAVAGAMVSGVTTGLAGNGCSGTVGAGCTGVLVSCAKAEISGVTVSARTAAIAVRARGERGAILFSMAEKCVGPGWVTPTGIKPRSGEPNLRTTCRHV